MLRLHNATKVILAGLLLVLATGCGVAFTDSFDGTELFRSIRLQGERKAGQELSLTIVVNQAYPVPVHIACYYEDGDKLSEDQLKLTFQERATPIGEKVLPPAPGHSPDDDVDDEELTFRFRVDEPGDYFVACLTPSAAENGLGLQFDITDPSSTRRPQ